MILSSFMNEIKMTNFQQNFHARMQLLKKEIIIIMGIKIMMMAAGESFYRCLALRIVCYNGE